ncbi:MAG: hypothetical protein DRH37_00745 [Deltaproteobacteria bacterium]|nr:MAG: hypothetical protein DRH37_00745 [Deltaproteobacteria bacterium]
MIEHMKVEDLTPHPLHRELYGDPLANMDEMNELVTDIKANGMLNPLIIDQDNLIISGQRRWEAAKILGSELVPCEQMAFEDEAQRIQWLISHNTYRTKSKASRIKEARVLENLYQQVAKAKMSRKELTKEDVLWNIARGEGKVLARDKAGEAVGLSPRTFVTGKQALETAERLRLKGDIDGAEAIEKKLETSVSGAKMLADKYRERPSKKEADDPQKILYWYVPYLENMVSVINNKTRVMRKRLNSTTPASLTLFIANIEAMADRMRTWYVPHLRDCPVCNGTMFVDGVACTNCFQGKVGVYVNMPPRRNDDDTDRRESDNEAEGSGNVPIER